jgi:hypothetical protein
MSIRHEFTVATMRGRRDNRARNGAQLRPLHLTHAIALRFPPGGERDAWLAWLQELVEFHCGVG